MERSGGLSRRFCQRCTDCKYIALGGQGCLQDGGRVDEEDDPRSQIVRFQVECGPSSVLRRDAAEDETSSQDREGNDAPATQEEGLLNLEGQGIMVYDRSSGGESHVRMHQS